MANNYTHRKVDQTLCWKCRNALGGCSWSDRFEPCEGWNAEDTLIDNGNTKTPSYIVRECPLFTEDDGKRETVSDDGFQNLMIALYKRTAQDYAALLERRDTSVCADEDDAAVVEYQLGEIEKFLPRWLTEKIKRERSMTVENNA